MTDTALILSALAIIVVTAGITALVTAMRMRRKVSYMLDALEDKELNFRFDERKRIGRGFNSTLNRLRTIFDKERKEIKEQEQFYAKMLDHVQTGVAVIDTSATGTAADGRVIYCNSTALEILGLSTFSNIRQLRNTGEPLYEAFRKVAGDNEQKARWYNERGTKAIALTASDATIGGRNVKVVAFNDISNEIAENEQESWTKLIRVLTHEIMNTVTPVASLSETLAQIYDGSSQEMKTGLDTITKSSRGLIRFVESYRNLTRVAAPVKKAFLVREMMERVMKLCESILGSTGATCTYTEKTEDILLYADEGQISQIVVNLVKNAVQAGATKIDIVSEIDAGENVVINVTNNGRPITKENSEEIFVPFYTTKQDGTGIGLSLSRQIMRLHNGTLDLTRSDAHGTVFTMQFK
ncbi:MAG: sensor histidine kinase [Candidatus Cryptobacteroides sp.]